MEKILRKVLIPSLTRENILSTAAETAEAHFKMHSH